MSLDAQRIHPLPPDVVAKINSSTSITHLNDVIVDLVKNALDAAAHTVFVTVDFHRGGCVVDDDGTGIPPAEFDPNGGLGKAHHTSKFHSEEVYGRRGSFLASLASLSLLTITSHHVRHPSTNSIIFHHSTPVARQLPAAQQGLRFSGHGTCVTVNDLFGNMPVRVKNRALALQKPDELDRQWDLLRQSLVSLMLASDSLAKLVISDASKDKRLIIRPRTRSLPTDELDLQRISSILAQAGLIEYQNADRWDAVSACVPDLSIHAAISLVPSPTKKVQFISVGMDPIFPRNSKNAFYSEINRLFSLSDFSAMGTTTAFDTVSAEQSDGHGELRSMAKTVSKWPMFYIRINTKGPHTINGDDQVMPESDKSIQRIMDVLSAMIVEFLKQHNLRSRAVKRKRKTYQTEGTDSPKSGSGRGHLDKAITEETLGGHIKLPRFPKATLDGSHNFGDWSRIRSAEPENTRPARYSHNVDFTRPIVHQKPTTDIPGEWSSQNVSKAAEDISPEASQQNQLNNDLRQSGNEDGTTDRTITWTDPYTAKSHLINSRTGQSVNIGPSMAEALVGQRPQSTGCLKRLRASSDAERLRSAILNRTQNTWVENLLDKWDNPAFSRSEKPINTFGAGHEAGVMESRTRDCSELCGFENLGLSMFRGKLRKQDLETAEIISQVDQKFVLAKMRTTSDHGSGDSTTLVLIDQHAADERCRVEKLFEELFTPSADGRRVQTVALESLVFEIPKTEKALFGRYMNFFGSWGVGYTVEQKPGERSAFVLVNTLPTLIAERCRLEPNLVLELIRGEIWRREENDMRLDGPDEDHSWVGRLNGCPQGMMDLLNSRACRTAIMFNDELTVDECQSLVRRLARCFFPFQCAHGRPSMIPVLDMNKDWEEEESERGFLDAFKDWRYSS